MSDRRSIGVVLGMIAAALVGRSLLAQPTRIVAPVDAPLAPPGVEVLTRGPIHEAYAQPVGDRPQATPLVPKPPPPPFAEIPAEQKPAGNVVWLAGYWAWDDERQNYIWISGIWRAPPPGQQWIPGRWNVVGTRWQWVPGFWTVQQKQASLTYLPPPPPFMDMPPTTPAPGPNYVFVPGTWVYRDNRYDWRPGTWVAYQPDWLWEPAHYVWTPGGYLFVEGYWDYPLRQRGLLFAPVALDTRISSRPEFAYRPVYVVHPDSLDGALFVRPAYRHYYFGDYFDPHYQSLGYMAWFEMRGGFGRDPLFDHDRMAHAADRRWEQEMRASYAARAVGQAPRPPRTLVEQMALERKTGEHPQPATHFQAVAIVSPITQINRADLRLQPVPETARHELQRAALQLADVSRQRESIESQINTRRPVLMHGQSPVRLAELQVPEAAQQPALGAKAPPAPPVRPEPHAHPLEQLLAPPPPVPFGAMPPGGLEHLPRYQPAAPHQAPKNTEPPAEKKEKKDTHHDGFH
jgi:hypothetical protein